jgi:predicted ferric reductase
MRRISRLLLLAAPVPVIVAIWLWNHLHHPMGNQLAGDAAAQLCAWGRLAGLLAAYGCLLQVLVISRIRWVEQAFGMDRLTRLHHFAGFSLVALLLAHPLLLSLGRSRAYDTPVAELAAGFLRTLPAAVSGLVLLLAAALLSMAGLRRRLGYERWHATHLALYLALALAFGHQILVGSDLALHPMARAFWLALYVLVVLAVLGWRLARPLWLFRRHGFAVAALTPETADVTSVHIQGRELGRLRAEAGQFVLVRFLAPGFWREEHPFSLSLPPNGRELRLTIRQLGDYTRRIPSLPIGTRAILDGPHGIFTARRTHNARVLLVAGGIGITPIRSVAEALLDAGREMVLLYANRSRSSAALFGELEALAAASGGRLRVVHVMSADPAWPGERGVLDGAALARLVPDLAARDAYLCGPPPMMRQVRAALRAAGVPGRRIFDERFTF